MLTKPDGTAAAEILEQRVRTTGMYLAHICDSLTATSFVYISFAFINTKYLEGVGTRDQELSEVRLCKLPGIPRFCLASS